MSVAYLAALNPRRARLGGFFDTIAGAVTGANNALNAGAIPAVTDVLQDPALPDVIQQVTIIKATEAAGGGGPGVGLSNVVGPLKVYAYSRTHSWFLPAAVLVVLGVPFLLGRATARK